MSHHGKKQQHPSAAKKQIPVSQEDNLQAQQQFAQYHHIVQSLHNSTDPAEAEEALAPLTSMSEAAQMALLKALGKEHTVDSADVLLAVNTFAPLKEVRKEARRSLIQLEATKTYPQWTPPAAQAPVIEATVPATPPRFWKGEYTDTREVQEIQLALYWEQGERYKEVRLMGFLLDFMGGGVKDFFTEVLSKRQAENRMSYMRSLMGDLTIVPCTLAKGRELLLEALEVNKKFKTKPHSDYTRNLPLIQELVLSAPEALSTKEDSQEEREQGFGPIDSAFARLAGSTKPITAMDVIRHIEEINAREEEDMFDDEAGEDLLDDFDIQETIESFLSAWVEEDYEEAYSLLASTSDLRDGLNQDEWVERRDAWAEQAHPEGLKYDIVLNLDDETLPPNVVSMHKEIEVFWSLEMQDTPLSTTLKELPMGTVVYKETGRHWFWVKYRLVEEDEEWRIQSMIDEGAAAQHLSIAELEQRIQTIADDVKAMAQEMNIDMEELDDAESIHLVEPEEDEDEDDELEEDLDDLVEEIEAEDRLRQLRWMTTRAMHYSDALIAQSPDNSAYYDVASAQASSMQDWERTAAYLERMAQQFPDQRGGILAVLAIILSRLCTEYEEEDMYERVEHFLALLEKTLRDSVAADNNLLSTILLANMLITKEENLEEAEALLKQAQTAASEPKEQAQVENALAKLADARDQPALALKHYQRTAELDPEVPAVWFNIGSIQRELKQNEAAIQSFLRAIQEDPEDSEAYVELSRIYIEQDKLAKAREILDEGLDIIDDAADLNAARAIVYTLEGHLSDAEELLTEAEEIDPDLDIVQEARQLLKARKAERQSFKSKSRKHKPKKR